MQKSHIAVGKSGKANRAPRNDAKLPVFKRFKNNRCGETLAEALVTFLIATISTIVLASSTFLGAKLVREGGSRSDDFFAEENEVDKFIYGINDGDDVSHDTLTLIDNKNEKISSTILTYKSENYGLIGFKNE